MAMRPLPDVEVLRQLLRYDPQTGKLFWLPRADGPRALQWNARYAGQEAFTCVSKYGYHCGGILRKTYQAHRVAWVIYYGSEPYGEIDHMNGNRSDNRIQNLRDVSHAINARNRVKSTKNTSGVMGVTYCRKDRKWAARIRIRGSEVFLGNFDTKKEAVQARKKAEPQYGYHANHGRAA